MLCEKSQRAGGGAKIPVFFLGLLSNMQIIKEGKFKPLNTDGCQINENKGSASKIGHKLIPLSRVGGSLVVIPTFMFV